MKKTIKKRKIAKKRSFPKLNKLSFLKQKKALLAFSSITILLLLIFSLPWIKNSVLNVFAAPIDLAAVVSSSGADISLAPGTYAFSNCAAGTSFTIPAGKTLHYERGAIIKICSGQTLNIAGGMDDHLYQIFDDQSGNIDKGVKFSAGNVLNVRPEWWGARVDDTPPTITGQYKTINSAAIEKAVNSHIDHVTNVIFASGAYYVDKPIVLRGNISLYGSGMQNASGTTITNAMQTDMPYIITDASPIGGKQGGTIKGLILQIRATSSDPIDIIHFANGTSNWKILENTINVYSQESSPGQPGWGIYLDGINNVTIGNNRSYAYRTGLMHLKGTDIKVFSNEVQNGSVEAGLHLDRCQGCVLENNIIFSDPNPLGPAVQKNSLIVEESPTAVVRNNRFDGCWTGIKIIGAGGEIRNNALIGNWTYGIKAENISSTSIESNSLCVSVWCKPPSVAALRIGDYGIKLDQVGDNVIIENNNISGWKLGSIGYEPGGTGAHSVDIEKNGDSYNQWPLPILGSGATPSVIISENWTMNNSLPTNITNFIDAPVGKKIFVQFGDSNTTVKFSGSNLQGNGGADWNPSAGDHMRCKKTASYWSCNCFDNTP